MKKFLSSMLACAVLAVGAISARAVQISYAVDAGAGFGVPMTITSGSGNTTLDTTPVVASILNVTSGTPLPIDIVNYALTTILASSSATTDSISDPFSYTIRFFSGPNFTGSFVDFIQTGNMQLTNIKEGSISDNNPGATIVVTPGSQLLDGNTISLALLTFDVPGAPTSTVPGVGPFISAGGKTDVVTYVTIPEPGSVALLIGAAAPLAFFRLRRSRKS